MNEKINNEDSRYLNQSMNSANNSYLTELYFNQVMTAHQTQHSLKALPAKS